MYVTYVGKKQWLEKMNSDDDLVDLESAEASQPLMKLMKRKQTLKGKETIKHNCIKIKGRPRKGIGVNS